MSPAAPPLRHWNQLSGSDQAPAVVLAVDFDASGRREATFHDLAQNLPPALPVWLAAQPGGPARDRLDPRTYVRWWTEEFGPAGPPVQAVLGYCAGSVFACCVADELAAIQGRRPRVVLFNPGAPDSSTLRRDFAGTLQSMSLLQDAERVKFLGRADEALGRCETFDDACAAVLDLYRESSGVMFDRAGIDADIGEELRSVFASYLSYLRAARAVTRQPEWTAARAVCSSDHPAEPAFTAESVRTPVPRRGLLADPDVAGTALGLITAED